MLFKKSRDKSSLSLTESKIVCGYEIKKMPIAAYLTAIETLTSLPGDFMENCFPGRQPAEILDQLIKFDKDSFAELIAGAFVVAPRYIIGVIADLTGIEAETLTNDPEIGIDGLIGIVDAFIEVNKLGKSLSGALALKAKIAGLGMI
ncbi:MAG: hypothetical protein LBU77_01925 [Clostridiales bacterium]|jgi:hypothetical protein|nr:hypothetical protein [Clostridiales bacterium]